MKFDQVSIENCEKATGIVVAIDVLRAFSTAAYMFGNGVKNIIIADTVENAILLKKRFPSAILMGEVDGLPITGFEYSNSPTEFIGKNLSGYQFIQRTTAGTQGISRSINAKVILASSFCCARATARFIERFPDDDVTFVITGAKPNGEGDEDAACADYIENLILGKNVDTDLYLQRVRSSIAAQKFIDPNRPDFPLSDLEYCLAIDKFDFAIQVERQKEILVMKPIKA